jgi:hypothetical protein
MIGEKPESRGRVPARMAKLETVAMTRLKDLDEGGKPFIVSLQIGRQLVKDGPELMAQACQPEVPRRTKLGFFVMFARMLQHSCSIPMDARRAIRKSGYRFSSDRALTIDSDRDLGPLRGRQQATIRRLTGVPGAGA